MSISGPSSQQWDLRISAQEAPLKELANSNSRRLLAHNRSFERTDVGVGDSVNFYRNAGWRRFGVLTKLVSRPSSKGTLSRRIIFARARGLSRRMRVKRNEIRRRGALAFRMGRPRERWVREMVTIRFRLRGAGG